MRKPIYLNNKYATALLEIPRLLLSSVAKQDGLNLTWSHNTEGGFLMMRINYVFKAWLQKTHWVWSYASYPFLKSNICLFNTHILAVHYLKTFSTEYDKA